MSLAMSRHKSRRMPCHVFRRSSQSSPHIWPWFFSRLFARLTSCLSSRLYSVTVTRLASRHLLLGTSYATTLVACLAVFLVSSLATLPSDLTSLGRSFVTSRALSRDVFRHIVSGCVSRRYVATPRKNSMSCAPKVHFGSVSIQHPAPKKAAQKK